MRTRIIAGLLLVPLLILIIVGGTPLYIGEAIIISIALHEFYKAFEAKDIKPLYYIGYIFSIYLLIKNYLKLPITFTYTLIFILFFNIYKKRLSFQSPCGNLYESHFRQNQIN